jgi:hypothetical protein
LLLWDSYENELWFTDSAISDVDFIHYVTTLWFIYFTDFIVNKFFKSITTTDVYE